MKKTRKTSRITQNKNDERFAKKVICQMTVCIFVFITIFINSKLSNQFSVQVNNAIRHYLYVSMDFDEVVENAKAYYNRFMNDKQSMPVNSDNTLDTKEEN